MPLNATNGTFHPLQVPTRGDEKSLSPIRTSQANPETHTNYTRAPLSLGPSMGSHRIYNTRSRREPPHRGSARARITKARIRFAAGAAAAEQFASRGLFVVAGRTARAGWCALRGIMHLRAPSQRGICHSAGRSVPLTRRPRRSQPRCTLGARASVRAPVMLCTSGMGMRCAVTTAAGISAVEIETYGGGVG